MTPLLADSYPTARRAFLDAAASAGARVESHPHPRSGLEGEALFVDVAEVGPAESSNVVLVVSGTHGVEGYLGSALQSHHLQTFDLADLTETTLVFVHALNPFGFSWVRRVNEDNVDLNRNFIDWTNPVPVDDGYLDLAKVLVPDSWSTETQERTKASLGKAMQDLGPTRSQQVISGGQFDDPTGLFYGGTGPTWSHRWLRDFLGRRLADVERAAVLDLHTGLGPWGHGALLSSDAPGSTALRRQQEWWGEVTSLRGGESIGPDVAGDWLSSVRTFAPNAEVTGVAIEYGTVHSGKVLDSLRADAVLHAHGDPTAPEAAGIRQQVRAAFLDDDPAWLDACWERYLLVVVTAIGRMRAKRPAD